MKYLYGALVVVLANFATGQNLKYDFCLFDITNNLDGRAYSIDNLPEKVGPIFKEEFEALLKEESFKNKFLDTFGATIQEMNNWYYDFERLGQIDVNRILPNSLHCLFVYEREYFPYAYPHATLETNSIVNYLVNHVFDHAMNENLMNVRLPLLIFNYNNAVACNFGKLLSSHEEFFVLHCVHNIMDVQTSMTTKIMHKASQLKMCVSDVPEVCESNDVYIFDIRAD